MAALAEQWVGVLDPTCRAWRVIGFHFYGDLPEDAAVSPVTGAHAQTNLASPAPVAPFLVDQAQDDRLFTNGRLAQSQTTPAHSNPSLQPLISAPSSSPIHPSLAYPKDFHGSLERFLRDQRGDGSAYGDALVGQDCAVIKVREAVRGYQAIYDQFGALAAADIREQRGQQAGGANGDSVSTLEDDNSPTRSAPAASTNSLIVPDSNNASSSTTHSTWVHQEYRFTEPVGTTSVVGFLGWLLTFFHPVVYLVIALLGCLPFVNCCWRRQVREIKYTNKLVVEVPPEVELIAMIRAGLLPHRRVYRNEALISLASPSPLSSGG